MDKCPQCGYKEGHVNTPFSNEMNYYTDGKTTAIFNRGEAEFTVGEGKDAVVWKIGSAPVKKLVKTLASSPIVVPPTPKIIPVTK